ncbi:MAG: asparaginase [Deltaproteobacteria bacterium]|nr:MAG: asparaginase [Deltaproteobacteria bacterium]
MSARWSRRGFFRLAAALGFGLPAAARAKTGPGKPAATPTWRGRPPLVVCSRGPEWGRPVSEAAWQVLASGGGVLDAVIAGANVVELDPRDDSVGYGGLPNEEGVVQLDSCVMYGPTHDCGAVACLEGIKTPSRVARLVMERTDHMLLVGRGAQRFARAHGFQVENLLTEQARLEWLRWKENLSRDDDWLPPRDGIYRDRQGRRHGTINVLGLDGAGNLAGVTTTSGLSFKIPGRVGDSPIIGAGLYVDNDVGAAGATGRGEEVIRSCASFFVVECMRRGMNPTAACLAACRRIIAINRRNGVTIDFSDKFVAVNKRGQVGCAAVMGSKKKPPLVAWRDGSGFHSQAGPYLLTGRGKNWD